MITIDAGRCNGCGRCIELCPNRAIYLVDNLATVDSTLCNDCRTCVAACPTDAIALLPGPAPVAAPVPTESTVPAVVPVRAPAAPLLQRELSLRERVLPAVGASLAWASREIVPLLADAILDSLDRKQQKPAARQEQSCPARREPGCPGGQGRGRRRRRRQRQGNSK